MIYGEDIIEEVRSRNDIVDVISTYVPLKKRAVLILGFVLFIMKNPLLFLSAGTSRCTIVSAAEPEATYTLF